MSEESEEESDSSSVSDELISSSDSDCQNPSEHSDDSDDSDDSDSPLPLFLLHKDEENYSPLDIYNDPSVAAPMNTKSVHATKKGS